ncbi:hypothetical protein BT69DRAFT_53025 [Atractiella rhizophila]|nr:hypothetical protein BT69DRAFT_53025 [Atractiella rhizophila]
MLALHKMEVTSTATPFAFSSLYPSIYPYIFLNRCYSIIVMTVQKRCTLALNLPGQPHNPNQEPCLRTPCIEDVKIETRKVLNAQELAGDQPAFPSFPFPTNQLLVEAD